MLHTCSSFFFPVSSYQSQNLPIVIYAMNQKNKIPLKKLKEICLRVTPFLLNLSELKVYGITPWAEWSRGLRLQSRSQQ